MKSGCRFRIGICIAALVIILPGCRSPSDSSAPPEVPATTPDVADDKDDKDDSDDSKKEESTVKTTPAPATDGLAELEPFDPPSLADLDGKADWVDQPVVDAY